MKIKDAFLHTSDPDGTELQKYPFFAKDMTQHQIFGA
jgi:hypothetical protein